MAGACRKPAWPCLARCPSGLAGRVDGSQQPRQVDQATPCTVCRAIRRRAPRIAHSSTCRSGVCRASHRPLSDRHAIGTAEMTPGTRQYFERAAIDAHKAGQTWPEFWKRYGDSVRHLEPYDRQRFRRLVRRLSHLLTCGNTDGMEPISTGMLWGEPWDVDDAEAADLRTNGPSIPWSGPAITAEP